MKDKYYLVKEARLKSLLLQELHLMALEAAGIDNWEYYDSDNIGEKKWVLDNIKDFNPMVKEFRNKYNIDPADDDELREYLIKNWTISDLRRYLIEEDMKKDYELVEK